MQRLREVNRIVVHHTDSSVAATVDDIRRWHKARGFSDIGYHYIIRYEPTAGWVVEPGRLYVYVGAHAKGANYDSLGVAVCGDYSMYSMPQEAYTVLVNYLAGLVKAYGLTADDVIGHREVPGASTECPGLRVDLEGLRADVRLLLNQ